MRYMIALSQYLLKKHALLFSQFLPEDVTARKYATGVKIISKKIYFLTRIIRCLRSTRWNFSNYTDYTDAISMYESENR